MSNLRDRLLLTDAWRQAAALAFAALILLACRLSEEIHLKDDGSGVYRAELILDAEEAEAMPDIKKELAKKPGLKIVDEGERNGEQYLVLEQAFGEVSELNDDGSEYSWTSSKEGRFTHAARLDLQSKPGDWEASLTEHRLEITMPGKVVDTNGERVSNRSVSWDRVAAGSDGHLYVESRSTALPSGVANGLWVVGVILLGGTAVFLVMRVRRHRRDSNGSEEDERRI